MGNKELIDFVNDELQGENGWWHHDNATKFHEACGTLIAIGMSTPDIKKLLTGLRNSIADEYGD